MSTSFAPTNRSSRSGTTGRKSNKLFFIIALVGAMAAAAGVLFMFMKLSETSKYYVLSVDVPAKTVITAEMIEEKVVPRGGEPDNALTIEYILENELEAAYPLLAGEVISLSNVAEQTPILADVAEGYVATSFTVPADYAAAGKIVRDDRVDIIATNPDSQQTKVVLRGVRVLDTAASLESMPEESEDGTPVLGGIPTIYTVALTHEDAVVLATVREFPLTIVLTDPNALNEEEINVQTTIGEIFGEDGVGLAGGDLEVAEEVVEGEEGAVEGEEPVVEGETPAADEEVLEEDQVITP